MAFFKSFQQNLPSVNISSILDSVSSRVDDLANAVSDVTYAVSDQLTEQVNTIINKVQEEEDGEQEVAQTCAAQEGKVGSKSVWPLSREPETSSSAKNNQSSDAAEVEYTPSQLEWEWRDGCWRVKKTEAELAEEEKKKKEEKELQEKREQRRRERRERRLQKAAVFQKNDSEDEEAAEGDGSERTNQESHGEETTQHRGSDDCDEPDNEPSRPENDGLSQQREEKDEQEEEGRCSLEGEGDDEGVPDTARAKVKKKKKDKKKEKGAKESSKKADKVAKKKEKGKKSKKKKKSKQEVDLTDSEEDQGPEAVVQSNVSSNNNMQATEQEGYSSEASSEHGTSIQRIKKTPSLTEGQPPPYQDRDRGSVARVCASRSRAAREVRRGSSPLRCSSEASVDQDTESYLNKGCEEDIPSDSTAVVGPEDSSGPQLPTAYEPEPLAKYGTLDVAFEYDSTEQWLAVTVTAATDIPALKQTGNISWQVHLVLLPTKKQRAKTGVQKGPCPVFTETFKFSRVEQEALGDCAVRFRLYSIRRMKKEKVLGEKVFHLTKLNLQGKIALPVTLEPGSELTGCGSVVSVSRSAGALSYRSTEDSPLPELLLGLVYNSATGSLSAEVIQGSHFKTTSSDKPVNGLFCCVKHFVGGQLYIMRDTYVTLTMLDSKGKEMSKCKTAVCRGQPSPSYKETFVFQVALFQLSEVSLVLSVFCRRSSMRPRERVGWVSLGLNSTGEEQLAHWTEMKEAEGQQVCHWHTLTDT
ncbi:synaptotagmin-14b isoform X2 [Dunckerocampus dactyliophorus]|uniref:synaptotagmin-14b isoform X2 n=1 Tax=Dunckerocampus dactyliophorus TaxID=161453 RepID=UPI0024071CEE|nr:synaptotagmin-14b isoform X2 [Dunckerocampus dactyliophorus]